MENIHKPERTCIICRKKKNKDELLRIIQSEEKYIFDKSGKEQKRGYYCCKDMNCLGKLSKHNKIKVDSDSLILMLNIIKNNNKNIINILTAMKNSNELVFGMNMTIDEIKKINFLVIAEDISKKNKTKLLEKAKEYNIDYINISNKDELGTIFGKEEVNVIGIKDKKIARGFIK